MKTILFRIFAFLIVFSLLTKSVNAQPGCCSWHGGVSGCDTDVGRKVCRDGTYSPTCICDLTLPTVPTQTIINIKATWSFLPNDNKTFNLSVMLDDPFPSQYSAVLNNCKGCDPGPSTDFFTNNFYFYNLKTGNYFLNVKKEVNGYWSQTSYYEIKVPTWYPPATPTVAPIVKYKESPPLQASDSKPEDNSVRNTVFAAVVLIFGAWINNKYFDRRV